MDDLISIIVPMYNSSEYIISTLNCLNELTYRNLELIFVDDGSEDNTLQIVNNYHFRNKMIIIKTISQSNSGVSSARNNGIKKAMGKYVFFLDADDYLFPDSIEKLYERIVVDNSDAIRGLFGIGQKNSYINIEKTQFKKTYINEEIEILKKFLLTDKIKGYSCNFLIKKNIIDEYNIRFDEKMSFMEDFIFDLQLFNICKSISILDEVTYIYFQNETSLSKSTDIYKRFNNINARYEYTKEYLKNNNNIDYVEDIMLQLAYIYLKTEKYIILNKKNNSNYDLKKMNKTLLNNYNAIVSKYKLKSKICLKYKILFYLIKYNKINTMTVLLKLM